MIFNNRLNRWTSVSGHANLPRQVPTPKQKGGRVTSLPETIEPSHIKEGSYAISSSSQPSVMVMMLQRALGPDATEEVITMIGCVAKNE
jgi:hypothetical protein